MASGCRPILHRRRVLLSVGLVVVVATSMQLFYFVQRNKRIFQSAKEELAFFSGRLFLEEGSSSSSSSSNSDKQNSKRKKYKLVVGGITRNNAKFLERFRKTLIRVLNETSQVWDLERVIIFENDSTDGTPDIIASWNCTGRNCSDAFAGKVELITEKLSEVAKRGTDIYAGRNRKGRQKSGRTCRTAYGRNRVLQRLRKVDEQTRIDYFLNLDMDEVNINLKGVETCFSDLPENWGACCANPYEIYYDLWVLRSSPRRNLTVSSSSNLTTADDYETWLQCDVWADCHFPGWHRAFRHIPANRPPIKVHSCFGGAAVYDVRYLRTGNSAYRGAYTPEYGDFYNGKETVEHFMLHEEIYKVFPNFTMYIQPKMLHDGGQAHRKGLLHPDEEKAFLASEGDPALRTYYARPDTGGR